MTNERSNVVVLWIILLKKYKFTSRMAHATYYLQYSEKDYSDLFITSDPLTYTNNYSPCLDISYDV